MLFSEISSQAGAATGIRGRRVAVVLPVELRSDALHRDLIPTAYGLQELGHSVTVYCPSASAETPGLALRAVGEKALADPDFWLAEDPDWVLILTWLGRGDIVEAAASTGATVVTKGDTDGLISCRFHPMANWQRMVLHQPGATAKLRASLHFARRVGPLYRDEMRSYRRSLAASDRLVVESAAARSALIHALRIHDSPEREKLRVLWNPVQQQFSRVEVSAAREPLIVAVGRWDDPQKDAALLRVALERVLAADPQVRVAVAGPIGSELSRLQSRRVEHLGSVPNTELPALLGRARMIVFASRWEGMPLSALESLAMGCRVVGTRLPAFREIAAANGGRVASRPRRSSLSRTILAELRSWDRGEHDPVESSAKWRACVDRRSVADAYAGLFEAGRMQRAS